ncbi:MAG: hypothetical protein COZ18_14500 [Flexibacter sp. CG_4_10_14_3_um_filter_32_15]|nr:MAG: hypothetical protein COZ18_14500 [Flexibacter sp. CG_4_10_14_3_um_filter_32_15]
MKSDKIQELNKSKTPIVAFDKELEKLQNVVLFPEKLEMANQFIKKYGLPKEYYEQIARQKEEKK